MHIQSVRRYLLQSNHNSHVKRIIVGLLVLAVFGFASKLIFAPATFGDLGHYRAKAILEEANLEPRLMTNESCLTCHQHEKRKHLKGTHKTVSCEFCHGAYFDHILDDKKIGTLDVKKGEEIRVLCLRCHNKEIQARPTDKIKTVALPQHLEEKRVRTTHTCDQCHYVHAPLEYVNLAKKMMRIKDEPEKEPCP